MSLTGDPRDSDPVWLLRMLYEETQKLGGKVNDLVTSQSLFNAKFEQHIADDLRQFESLHERASDLSTKLEPLVSEQQFHERVKAAVNDSAANKRSWWNVMAQVAIAFAALAAVCVSISAIFLTGHP